MEFKVLMAKFTQTTDSDFKDFFDYVCLAINLSIPYSLIKAYHLRTFLTHRRFDLTDMSKLLTLYKVNFIPIRATIPFTFLAFKLG